MYKCQNICIKNQEPRNLYIKKLYWGFFQTFKAYIYRPVEIKKSSGGATKFEILSATMVGRRRKFLIPNRLKGLEKFNTCRRWVT